MQSQLKIMEPAASDGVRDIFQSSLRSLVKAIKPVYLEVSNKLYADEWISKPAHEAVAGESSDELAATRIVKEVETKLK